MENPQKVISSERPDVHAPLLPQSSTCFVIWYLVSTVILQAYSLSLPLSLLLFLFRSLALCLVDRVLWSVFCLFMMHFSCTSFFSFSNPLLLSYTRRARIAQFIVCYSCFRFTLVFLSFVVYFGYVWTFYSLLLLSLFHFGFTLQSIFVVCSHVHNPMNMLIFTFHSVEFVITGAYCTRARARHTH